MADKVVVAGSEYRWDDVLVRRGTHPDCDALAWHIAKADWQLDTVYVVDICLTPDVWTKKDVPRIVEFNAFSSSGLYACDTYAIVTAVSAAAEKEHRGEMEP